MGMMPHPERASDPLMGSSDGLGVFQSMLAAAQAVRPAEAVRP
jgi:phosphoribosylformylglycinamidine synthase